MPLLWRAAARRKFVSGVSVILQSGGGTIFRSSGKGFENGHSETGGRQYATRDETTRYIIVLVARCVLYFCWSGYDEAGTQSVSVSRVSAC